MKVSASLYKAWTFILTMVSVINISIHCITSLSRSSCTFSICLTISYYPFLNREHLALGPPRHLKANVTELPIALHKLQKVPKLWPTTCAINMPTCDRNWLWKLPKSFNNLLQSKFLNIFKYSERGCVKICKCTK